MKKRQRDLLAGVGLAIFLLLVTAHYFWTGQPFSKTWLPNPSASLNRGFALANLPVKVENVQTEYGPAKKYTPSNNWKTIYEFHYNPLLQANACPNISNIRPVESTLCLPIGISRGAIVYAINRRLPSGITEYYTKRGSTFIYIKSGGGGGQSLDYLNTFIEIPDQGIDSYLAGNSEDLMH